MAREEQGMVGCWWLDVKGPDMRVLLLHWPPTIPHSPCLGDGDSLDDL